MAGTPAASRTKPHRSKSRQPPTWVESTTRCSAKLTGPPNPMPQRSSGELAPPFAGDLGDLRHHPLAAAAGVGGARFPAHDCVAVEDRHAELGAADVDCQIICTGKPQSIRPLSGRDPAGTICQGEERPRSAVLRTSHNLWLSVAMTIVIGIAVLLLSGQPGLSKRSRGRRAVARSGRTDAGITFAAHGRGNRAAGIPADGRPRLPGRLQCSPAEDLAALQAALSLSPVAGLEDCQRLFTLITAKLDEMAQTVRVRQQGDIAQALAIVHTGRGKETMDQIRTLAAQVIAQENDRFREHTAGAQRHGYQTRILVSVGSAVPFRPALVCHAAHQSPAGFAEPTDRRSGTDARARGARAARR